MTDVELVFPYELQDQESWVLPPLGLGYLAAGLEERGIDWGVTDCTFMGLEPGLKNVMRKKPRIVGIYSMVTLGHNAIYMAGKLKGEVDLLVAGGPLPSVYPGNFFPEFDICIQGEADLSFPALADSFLKGQRLPDITGAVFSNQDNGKSTGGPVIDDIATIPHPDRSKFPNRRYMEYWQQNFGYSPASIIATRGCPYTCDFCSRPTSGNHFRKRITSDILDEIREIHDLGYRYLWFADDAFTFDSDFVFELCQGIGGLDIDLGWDCLSRVDRVDDDLVRAMSESGLRRVYLGIESGSNETLRLMRKGATVEDADRAIGLYKRHGVKTGGFFMIGYPGETPESIWRTVEFSAREDLDYVSYTVPYPLPGSSLYERYRTYVDPLKEWRVERENSVFIECGIPESALGEIIEVAYKAHGLARTRGRTRALDFLKGKEREFKGKLACEDR